MTKTEESQKFWSFSEDIQFLRALAVLAVVFYYENFIDLASGYLGVDVFFVVSGYLIHEIIANKYVKQEFSLFNFYTRRIRKVFLLYLLLFFQHFHFYGSR